MNLEQLIKEVLELDAKATKGPWNSHPNSNVYPNQVFVQYCEGGPNEEQTLVVPSFKMNGNGSLIAHYRTSAVKLAKACEVMREALYEISVIGQDQLVSDSGKGEWASRALAEAEKIAEGEE